jgi:Flp pilus assembly protein TadG
MSQLTHRCRAHGVRPRRTDRGAVVALVAVGLIPLMLAAALVVDGGRFWVERTRIQTASEAGAIRAAKQWATTGVACTTAVTASVRLNAGSSATSTCAAPGGIPGGRIDVSATSSVPTLFSEVLRRSSSIATSRSAVFTGGANAAVGLRPLALCVNHPTLLQWVNDGYPAGRRVTFDLTTSNINCNNTGNWAMLDFDGTGSIQTWINSGYGVAVAADSTVFGDPGKPANNISFASAYGQKILLALFDPAYRVGNGANTQFKIASFLAVTLHSVQLTADPRSIEVTLERTVTTPDRCCVPSSYNRGYVSWTLCSLEGTGTCP